jgi:anti-sigma B factor antagonist
MGQQTALSVEKEEGMRAARLIGELDLASYDQALEQMSWAFDGEGDVELDLSGLSFMDSTGVRLLIQIRNALEGKGKLILRSPTDNVAKVLRLIGMDELGIDLEP